MFRKQIEEIVEPGEHEGGGSWDKILQKARETFLAAGYLCSAATLVTVMGIGFWEIGHGVRLFVTHEVLSSPPTSYSGAPGMVLYRILKGLEFMFLAPAALLTFSSLEHYLSASIRGRDHQAAEGSVSRAKAFVIGLMIAVLATDMIARMYSQEGLTYEVAITRCLGIVALAAYLFVLERSPYGPVPGRATSG